METMTSTLRGSIVNIGTSRLHDIWLGYTTETRLDFIGLAPLFSAPGIPVRIVKLEGKFWSEGATLHGTMTWKGIRYQVKIVFKFYADGDPHKVEGSYEMDMIDERDYGKPD